MISAAERPLVPQLSKNGDNARVAKTLRELREQAEITQEEMARRVGLTLSGYRTYEQAKRSISAGQIPRFAEALNVPVSAITRRLWPEEPATQERQAELVTRILGILGPERAHCLSDIMREIEGWPERDQDAVIGIIRAAVFSGVWGKRAPENQ